MLCQLYDDIPLAIHGQFRQFGSGINRINTLYTIGPLPGPLKQCVMKYLPVFCLLVLCLHVKGQSTLAYWDFENVATRPNPPILASEKASSVSTAYVSLYGGTSIGSPDVCGGNESWATNFWTTSTSRSSSDYFLFGIRNGTTDRSLEVAYVSLRASVSSGYSADRFDIYFDVEGDNRRLATGVQVGTSCGAHSFAVNRSVGPGERARVYLYPYGQDPGAQAATLRIDEVAIAGVSLLPVTWGAVRADRTADQVVVRWATIAEYNSDFFVVERSGEGQPFRAIGQLPAAGWSDHLREYTYVDRVPVSGSVRYRIEQVDRDGSRSYSDTLVIAGSESSPPEVYPQPAVDYVAIRLPDEEARPWIQISDLQGRVWYRGLLPEDGEIPLFDWPVGMYILRVGEGAQVWTGRLIIGGS